MSHRIHSPPRFWVRTVLLSVLVFLAFHLFGRDALASEPRAEDPSADHEPHGSTPPDHEPAPVSQLTGGGEIDSELDIDLRGAPPATDKKAYADFLRLALSKARPRVIGKLEQKMATSQSAGMNRLSFGMFLFSLLGLGLAIRPLFLLKKYPGREKTLIGYGFASAGLFFLTVNLFAIVIGLLKLAQGAAGHFTNPQVAVIEAAFDILDRNAEDLVDIAPKLIEPSLHRLAQGDASFIVVLLENFKGIKSDVDAVLAVAKAMKALDGLFAWIPSILTLVAVVTFALSAKETLLAVVRLPEVAASGSGGGDVIRGTLRRVKNELLATLCLSGIIIVLAITGGLALRAAVYLQTAKVSSVVLFGGLALSAIVLVLNVAVILAASSAALGKLHKIFQRRFHEGLPLGAHGRFWKRAPLAIAGCFLFPLGYELLAEKGVEAVLHRTLHAANPSYAAALVGSPALIVVGFFVCFALVLGVHAMIFLFRYPASTIALAASPAAALEATLPVVQPVRPAAPVPPPASVSPANADELAIFDRLVAPTSNRFGMAATLEVQWRPSAPESPIAQPSPPPAPAPTEIMSRPAPRRRPPALPTLAWSAQAASDIAPTTMFHQSSSSVRAATNIPGETSQMPAPSPHTRVNTPRPS